MVSLTEKGCWGEAGFKWITRRELEYRSYPGLQSTFSCDCCFAYVILGLQTNSSTNGFTCKFVPWWCYVAEKNMALQGLSASVQGAASSSVKLADVLSVCRSETRGKSEKSHEFFFSTNFVQLWASPSRRLTTCIHVWTVKGHISVREPISFRTSAFQNQPTPHPCLIAGALPPACRRQPLRG